MLLTPPQNPSENNPKPFQATPQPFPHPCPFQTVAQPIGMTQTLQSPSESSHGLALACMKLRCSSCCNKVQCL